MHFAELAAYSYTSNIPALNCMYSAQNRYPCVMTWTCLRFFPYYYYGSPYSQGPPIYTTYNICFIIYLTDLITPNEHTKFIHFKCIQESYRFFLLVTSDITLYLSTPLQGVFKQFGYGNSDNAFTDESEVKLHQRLEKLYLSTRAAKVWRRHISCLLFSLPSF